MNSAMPAILPLLYTKVKKSHGPRLPGLSHCYVESSVSQHFSMLTRLIPSGILKTRQVAPRRCLVLHARARYNLFV